MILESMLIGAVVTVIYGQSLPVINTPAGPIKGMVVPTLGKDIVQFRNIPYAKPPVGDLRFEQTVPIEPWTGTLDGTVFGPSKLLITHQTHGKKPITTSPPRIA